MLARIHIWIGLIAAVPWILQGITGALLVFERQLDAATNPSLFYVQPTEQRLNLDHQLAVVKRERPDLVNTAYGVDLTARPGYATMILAKPNSEAGPKEGTRLFVDPYRGVLLGTQSYRESLMGKVYNFHRTFYIEPWGKWITSFSAILLMASAATGFVLYFYRRRQRLMQGRLYRWHTRLGVWMAPMIFLIAFNGAFVTYRFMLVPLIYLIADGKIPEEMQKPIKIDIPPNASRITLERALQIAEEAVPNATNAVMTEPMNPKRPITVIRKKQNEPRELGGTFVLINPYTGQVMGINDFTDGSLGNRLTYLSIHLHTGQVGGYFGEGGRIATQLLWLGTALCIPLLAFFAIASRWKRRSKPSIS
ncbi:MAG: PepSY-associated TM helix domain-containing protein [Gemmatales bacterium]